MRSICSSAISATIVPKGNAFSRSTVVTDGAPSSRDVCATEMSPKRTSPSTSLSASPSSRSPPPVQGTERKPTATRETTWLRSGSLRLRSTISGSALDLRKSLFEGATEVADRKRDLAAAWDELGWAQFDAGDEKAAGVALAEALRLREEIQRAQDKNIADRASLVSALRGLGVFERRRGKSAEAIKLFERSLDQSRRLDDRASNQGQRAETHTAVAWARANQRRYAEAIADFRKAVEIRRSIAADSRNLAAQTSLATSLESLGWGQLYADEFEAAKKSFAESKKIMTNLDDDKKLITKANRDQFERAALNEAVAERAREVQKDVAAALDRLPKTAAELLIYRSSRQVRLGASAEALATAESLRKLAGKDGGRLFDLARCYAAMARTALNKDTANISQVERAFAADCIRQSFKALNQARGEGYQDWIELFSTSDLDVLRREPDYRKLVEQAPSRPLKIEPFDPNDVAPDLNLAQVGPDFRLQLKDGKVEVAGALADSDPNDGVRTKSRCKIYTIPLVAGNRYVIDLRSTEFDAYLRLETAGALEVASDDDGGGGLDARIIYICPRTEMHRIVATSFGSGLGRFRLSVTETSIDR